jgi:predicted enzyme related to lactoylglutathione lyase
MSSTTVLAITFDARDAATLAAFWSEALHRKVNDGASQDFASIAPNEETETGPLLMFVKVPEAKSAKNRIHFDLKTTQVESETTRLIALGATELRPLSANDGKWVSFADPEGNEFDLVVV